MLPNHHGPTLKVLVLTANDDFEQFAQAAFSLGTNFALSMVKGRLVSDAATLDIGDAAVVVVDLDSTQPEEFSALGLLMRRISGSAPVVVVTDVQHESVPRKLVQMRVADFLVKPTTPVELASACTSVAQNPTLGELKEAQICTFLPAAGGVGVTTLAIQAALTLHRSSSRGTLSTCLVDLNLTHSACADYLDLKPRLDLREIEPHPERLDGQLMEIMLSRHSSGLAVIAAPSRPTDMHPVNPIVVTRLLDLVSLRFDHVVIDMPRTWFPWTDNILRESDKLFIVSTPTVPTLRKAKQLVIDASQRLGRCSQAQVIVNGFQRRLFSPGLRPADITRTLGDSFGGTIPYNPRLAREAIDRGVPLDQVKRRSNVAVALKRVIYSTAASQKKVAPPASIPQTAQKKTPAGGKDHSISWAQ
jgi:pilus assembly protein CpaE